MADEVFAQVPKEGNTLDIEKAFDRLETKETSPESQSETKETEAQSQQSAESTAEEKVPFHKHPRWQKTQQELKETREKLAKLESERTQTQTPQPPAWWVKQYGDTPESKERYQTITQKDGELDWIKQSVLGELEQRTQAEQTQTREAEDYVDTQIQELTDEGLKFDRNSLLKFMVDFQEEYGPGSLLDSEGNYDFRKSLSLMQRLQPAEEDTSTDTKKQLASQAGRGKSQTQSTTKIPSISRRDLRKGWREMGI